MEIHLRIIGVLLILLALIHFSFEKYFDWKRELSSLSIMNRQMMYVHSFFIALTVLLMGVLCLASAEELAGSHLGKQVALGVAVFWIIRLVIQFFGYSSKIWKGKRFETGIHILFSLFWLYLSVVFLLVYLQ
jgi:hypothetical protein